MKRNLAALITVLLLVHSRVHAGPPDYLTNFGLTGLSTFVDYAHGELLAGLSEDEVDVTVDYRVASGPLKNLWLRFRYGHNLPSNAPSTEEYRAIINYTFAI